jgi:VanZ family protein
VILTVGTIQGVAQIASVVCLLLLAFLSLLPSQWMRRTGLHKTMEHFLAYSGSGFIFVLATGARYVLATTVAIVLLAAALEYTQKWARGRSADLDTFIAGAAGAAGGAIAGWAIMVIAG